MPRPLSVQSLLQRSSRRTGTPPMRPRPAPEPGPRGGRVRRFLAQQWQLYQLLYLPPLTGEPFLGEENFLHWSGNRLDGEVLPSAPEDRGTGRSEP